MSIFSRIFRSSDARQNERSIHKAEQDAHQQLKALGDIGMAIVHGAQNCSEHVKPMLRVPERTVKPSPGNYPEIWVFYEFLYFFMHMTMRHASSRLREDQIQRLQGFLGPLLSSTAVDSFFHHWPEDLKEKMRSEFYSKLNDAEVEYSKCKELLSKSSPLTGSSLFSQLARNVAELSGDASNPAILVS